jgi:hypothetical protein
VDISLALAAAVGLAVLAGAAALVLRGRRTPAPAPQRPAGTRTPGRVAAVRQQTFFDRDRNNIRVPVRVEYTDPRTGESRTGTYVLDRYTANIPALIGQPVGVAAFGSPARPGAVRHPGAAAELAPEADAEGFRELLEPIPVDVFVGGSAADPAVRIVFRP